MALLILIVQRCLGLRRPDQDEHAKMSIPTGCNYTGDSQHWLLMLLSGLSENPILVSITGRYAPMRERLMDGSVNLEIAQDDVIRLEHLTPLKNIGEKFRFVTAPRRNPYSYGTNRSLCMVVNSINSTTLGVYFDDFWGNGSRRYQLIVYSISAPKCKVLNLKPKWRSQCIKDKGNATACNQYILDNFETFNRID